MLRISAIAVEIDSNFKAIPTATTDMHNNDGIVSTFQYLEINCKPLCNQVTEVLFDIHFRKCGCI